MSPLEKAIAFLGRHFGPPRLALLVAVWVVLLGVWGTFARNVLPMEHRLQWDMPLEVRAPLYARFDSGWYLSIIERGYGPPPPPGNPSSHAFFPLYPWTAKVLHRTFALDGFYAGMLVAYAALFLALPLFFREARARFGDDERAWRSVLFLLLFPTAFYLASMYAESMFLLFALLAFRDARAGRVGRAVLWGFLLGLTRASALAAAPALVFASLEPRPGDARPRAARMREALVVGVVPFATVWAWVFGIGLVKGEPGLYFRSLGGWHRGSSPLAGAVSWLETARDYFAGGLWRDHPLRIFDYGCVALFLYLAIRLLARRRWADGLWIGAALALPISTGLSYGIPRYVLGAYPAFYELESIFGRGRLARLAWWTASAALLLFAAARFVNALVVA